MHTYTCKNQDAHHCDYRDNAYSYDDIRRKSVYSGCINTKLISILTVNTVFKSYIGGEMLILKVIGSKDKL